MQYRENFSGAELEKIIEEGLLYMCACPAQVAQALQKVRELYLYQKSCLSNPQNDPRVHQTIAQTSVVVHAQLEACLERVLEIEQWDRATLTMPPGLRQRQLTEIDAESGFKGASVDITKN